MPVRYHVPIQAGLRRSGGNSVRSLRCSGLPGERVLPRAVFLGENAIHPAFGSIEMHFLCLERPLEAAWLLRAVTLLAQACLAGLRPPPIEFRPASCKTERSPCRKVQQTADRRT